MSAALIAAALSQLESVLCDPEGRAGIRGSDEDNAIIDAALSTIRAALAAAPEPAEPVAWTARSWLADPHSGHFVKKRMQAFDVPLYAAPPAPAPIAQPDAWRWRWPATPEYKATPWEYKDTAPAVLAQANGDQPEIEALAVIKGAHAAPTVESAIAALVTALCESKGWLRDYADSVVRDAIDRKPAGIGAQPTQEPLTWVPVADRLPPKFVEVLVAFSSQTSLASTGQYTDSPHDKHGWCYPSENNGSCDDGSDPAVTHWMPLPDPPQAAAGIGAQEQPPPIDSADWLLQTR